MHGLKNAVVATVVAPQKRRFFLLPMRTSFINTLFCVFCACISVCCVFEFISYMALVFISFFFYVDMVFHFCFFFLFILFRVFPTNIYIYICIISSVPVCCAASTEPPFNGFLIFFFPLLKRFLPRLLLPTLTIRRWCWNWCAGWNTMI